MYENNPNDDGNYVRTDSKNLIRQTPRSQSRTVSRRRLLGKVSVGGSILVAGCGRSDPEPPSVSEDRNSTISSSDNHFRIPVANNPAKTTFFPLAPWYIFATVVKERPTYEFRRFLWETGVWSDGIWVEGEIHYNWIEEPIQITPTEVSVSIRDDARWSDGHQITGKDIAVTTIANTIRTFFPPYYATEEQNIPATLFATIDGFDISKQEVTYRSSPGYFARFWDWSIRRIFGAGNPSFVPTHVEPYGTYADAVIETAKRAQKGEIEPWKRDAGPNKESLTRKHLGNRKYVEKFSSPEHVLTAGAWNLVEMRGSEEFIFEKNTYHRNADTIDFDRVILEYIPSVRRKRAALAADRLDYGSALTPESTVDAFPDHIDEILVPGNLGTGNELGITLHNSGVENRAIRAAIMYAIDHSKVANNVHGTAAIPITTPGGACWDATDYVSQEWITNNLITYTKNREKAARLMDGAGYSKKEGQWADPEEEPLTLTLATANDTPQWEPTVASQLSDFGIETSVQTLSDDTFDRRANNGDFPIWVSDRNSTTNIAPATLFVWYDAAIKHRKHDLYPDEQYKQGNFSPNGMPLPRTEDRWRVFSIKAPPIGEPAGPLMDYHPAALSLMFKTNPPEAEFRRRVKTGLWLANWFLPTIPINKTYKQHFIDRTNWVWPRSTQMWDAFVHGGLRWIETIFTNGNIQTSSDDDR